MTTECPWCLEVYRNQDYAVCPNCAVNTDTKGITIIKLDDKDQEH